MSDWLRQTSEQELRIELVNSGVVHAGSWQAGKDRIQSDQSGHRSRIWGQIVTESQEKSPGTRGEKLDAQWVKEY